MASESRAIEHRLIIHSDHGSQFTSWGFSELIRKHGLMGSMGTIGDCYDNAPMESFWGSMQIELLNRKKWRTKIELSIAIAEWIEHFYNPERLHSSLGYVPPVEFEALHSTSTHPDLTLTRVVRKTGSRSKSMITARLPAWDPDHPPDGKSPTIDKGAIYTGGERTSLLCCAAWHNPRVIVPADKPGSMNQSGGPRASHPVRSR